MTQERHYWTVSRDIMTLQQTFNLSLCVRLFGKGAPHLYSKWMEDEGNILSFMSRLDAVNWNILMQHAMMIGVVREQNAKSQQLA